MVFIEGGACAAKGFKAAGIHCGIRANGTKKDLALILADRRCAAAGVYTQNLVKAAPVLVTQRNLEDGYAQAVLCNSGNANACNSDGIEVAEKMCALVARHTSVRERDVIVASTGVIGRPLNIAPMESHMESLVSALKTEDADAAEAIMTTDLVKKQAAVRFEIDGTSYALGGIAKGSGMIHPNMGTMLVFLTTDAYVTPPLLQKALREDARKSFNMISVDGDTSTNDTLTILASGAAGGKVIDSEGDAYEVFKRALNAVTTKLCRMIAKDGEGATKLLTCEVEGAKDEDTARTVAKSVISSSLVKAAMFGADANWGRVLCAIGYSGADVDVQKIDVSFESEAGAISVCEKGMGLSFDEAKAKEILLRDEITIRVRLSGGNAAATAWGCDLTYDYVKINGDYRS